MISNQLKMQVKSGNTLIGAWLSVPCVSVAEAMASCGFDWMAVDFEHSAISIETAIDCFIAAERWQVSTIARLPCAEPYIARRLLDGGAKGLIVPVVESVAKFKQFAKYCSYPPMGKRGVGLGRANTWGDEFDSYFRDFSPVLIPQIETITGVKVAADLIALDCVDALFVGPYDLSVSLGQPGNFDTLEFKNAMSQLKLVCSENGKPLGIHQVTPDTSELKARLEEGFRFIAFGTDLIALRHTFKNIQKAL